MQMTVRESFSDMCHVATLAQMWTIAHVNVLFSLHVLLCKCHVGATIIMKCRLTTCGRPDHEWS